MGREVVGACKLWVGPFSPTLRFLGFLTVNGGGRDLVGFQLGVEDCSTLNDRLDVLGLVFIVLC